MLSEYCPGEIDERSVCENAFELVFAFDEIVALGHRENVNLRDIQAPMPAARCQPPAPAAHTAHTAWRVQTNLEMESHEEKLAIMIRQSKEREAKEAMKEKSKQLSIKARDNRRGGPLGIPDMPSAISSMGAITSACSSIASPSVDLPLQ